MSDSTSKSTEDISLLEAIYSQRATRHFSTRPVSSDDVRTILKAAVRAPSGGNRQPWRFIVIRESETKRQLGEWYLSAWMASVDESLRGQEAYRSGEGLGKGMAEIPVVILVCIDQDLGFGSLSTVTEGASVYPAVQNLLLTSRSLGLGTVLTTLHTLHEQEIKDLLGIPERIHTVALIPLGYPAEGESFGGSKRKPIREVAYYDKWGASEETTSQ